MKCRCLSEDVGWLVLGQFFLMFNPDLEHPLHALVFFLNLLDALSTLPSFLQNLLLYERVSFAVGKMAHKS